MSESMFYIRASLIAQLVKNPPTMQETPVWFPGSGRFPGEGIGYPFQSSWASLVAQLVKNLPAMQLRRSPGGGKGCPLQYSGLENSMDIPWSHKESDTTEQLSLSHSIYKIQEKFFWKSIRSQNRVQQSRKTQI